MASNIANNIEYIPNCLNTFLQQEINCRTPEQRPLNCCAVCCDCNQGQTMRVAPVAGYHSAQQPLCWSCSHHSDPIFAISWLVRSSGAPVHYPSASAYLHCWGYHQRTSSFSSQLIITKQFRPQFLLNRKGGVAGFDPGTTKFKHFVLFQRAKLISTTQLNWYCNILQFPRNQSCNLANFTYLERNQKCYHIGQITVAEIYS